MSKRALVHDKKINLKIPVELKEWLRGEAKKQNILMSELARRIIGKKLATEKMVNNPPWEE